VRSLLPLLAVVAIATACTEQLVTPGGCPELCPGGTPVIRDTLIAPIVGGDSTFFGYASLGSATALPVANGGALGDARAVIRFIPRGDSVFVSDTARSFTIDSVVISVVVSARDTTVSGLAMELYRLPATFDSTTTFAEVAEAMTPATLLRTVPIADAIRSERFPIVFQGPDLDLLAFGEADSTRLVVGVRLTGPVGAGAYLGAVAAGDATPLYVTYTDIGSTDTLIQKQPLQRGVEQNLTVISPATPVATDLLTVGGFPSARSFIRFDLPAFLRDSATIVRATLELIPDRPLVGIPGDSARIDVRGLLADIGAKSVVLPTRVASVWVHPGDDTVRIELSSIAQLWQGVDALPAAIRLSHGQEYASFLTPQFRSSVSLSGRPQLRITYRPPYAVEAY
jgi:hypothetical protein